jgi:fumarate reductase subunit C
MTRKLQTNSFTRSAVLYAVFLLLAVQNVSAQMFHVDSVRFSSAPSIRSDSLFYTLDCYFQEKPANYWSYYDNLLNAVVIEFIDNLLLIPEVKFPHTSPFKDLKVKAVETQMALSKVMTRMVFILDKGPASKNLWNYNVTLHNGTTLRVTIWKKMESYQLKMAKEKRTRFFTSFIIGLSLSLAIAVTGIIVFRCYS